MGLDRVVRVARALQVDTFNCPVITIAGTNGKGSCVECLMRVYQAAGYRAGTYTSPHLQYFHERIRINGIEISDEALVIAFNRVREAQFELSNPPFLSYFEFTTLSALVYFQQQQLDVIILEVGLGGRLDAVNAIDPLVSVVVGIDLDHQDKLGETREEIAREKMGIARRQKPLVCGDPDPPKSIEEMAKKMGCDLYQTGREFYYEAKVQDWNWFGLNQHWKNLPLPAIKLQNAATALQVISLLQIKLPVTDEALHIGLRTTRVSGRFEQMSDEPKVIFDVAHNPQSCRWLASQLENLVIPGRVHAVCGMLSNKAFIPSLAPLCRIVSDWYLTPLETPRSAKTTQLVQALQTQEVKTCYTFATVADALSAALMNAKAQDAVVVFGSFYTVGAAKTWFLRRVQ